MIVFRVGSRDAELLAGELGMDSAKALTQTKNYNAWIKVMQNGTPKEPHLLATLPPPPAGTQLQKVIAHGRARHMMLRSDVEARIAVFFPKPHVKRPRRRKRHDPDLN